MLKVLRGVTNDFVSLLDEYSGYSSGSGNSQRISFGHHPHSIPRPIPVPLPIPVQPQLHPTRLYHGSSLERVAEIFRTHLFLVGNARPPAFWMADTPEKTRPYCGTDGGILMIDILPGTPLTKEGGGVYIFEIEGAQPFREYYEIPNLKPVAVFDHTGTNRIM